MFWEINSRRDLESKGIEFFQEQFFIGKPGESKVQLQISKVLVEETDVKSVELYEVNQQTFVGIKLAFISKDDLEPFDVEEVPPDVADRGFLERVVNGES